MTLVTSRISEVLSNMGTANVQLVSSNGVTGWKWTARKHAFFLHSLFTNARFTGDKKPCYFVPDSNRGLWLNILEAPFLRLGFSEVWLHHHVFSYVAMHDMRMKLFLRLLGKNTRHIVLGDTMAENLSRNYGTEHHFKLTNAAFVTDIPQGRVRNTLNCIGFLGNISQEKGIDLYMDTLRSVQSADDDVSALMAGPINDPTTEERVHRFCAERPGKRTWVGPVHGDTKQDFFDNIDMLLFPTLYRNEALPVTIYEALAAGVAVSATDRGCIPEQLSGLDSVFDQAGFVEKTVARIRSWREKPEEFRAASAAASRTFHNQKQEAERCLDQLAARLSNGTCE